MSVARSADYRQRMQRLTEIDLQTVEVGLYLWEYRPGDWLAPHVDKKNKIVTQIVYLTEQRCTPDASRS